VSLHNSLYVDIYSRNSDFVKMSTEEPTTNGGKPGERVVIGVSFGNSNSSIAWTTTEDKAEVIANEDGGK
jgi:molecular chaperone DnaK (HSP70)